MAGAGWKTESNDQGPQDEGARRPSLWQAFLPLVVLAGLLALSVRLFADDSSYGPNQIALVLAAVVAALIGRANGLRWASMQEAIVSGISVAMPAVLILLAVGALIGAWILSGTVPAMVYWGLDLLHPRVFYLASAVICAMASLATGSSWTTAGTLGIGLIGISQGLGLNPAITAGAVISGAYFGDKLSPLSDTTNLASAVAGTELFTHIRHMLWTTVPSFALALVLYGILGWSGATGSDAGSLTAMRNTLAQHFDVSLWAFLPPALVLYLALRRRPALPTILAGAFLGVVVALVRQSDLVVALAGEGELHRGLALVKGAWTALATGFVATTGDGPVDELLSRGGMASMLNTVWLILTALSFGAVMEHTGLLRRLVELILRAARGTGSLIASVVGTTILANAITSDQFMAIVVPGRMFREEFRRRGLKARNLSRTIEDAGTLTSPLIPWNTCGAYMAATLGVATASYWPYCFLALINPVVAIVYGWRQIALPRYAEGEDPKALDQD